MKWSTALLFVLLAPVVAGFGDCNSPRETNCPAGETTWKCTIQPNACHMAYITYPCASNMQDAIASANSNAIYTLKPVDQDIVGTVCTDTGGTRIHGESAEPKYTAQDFPPACDGTSLDTACLACAKDSCCEAYQACSQDATCSCWVYCLAAGNAMDVCAQADSCGPFNAVAASAETCLELYCPAQCINMGSTCDDTKGGSPSSGGAP